MVYGTFDSVTFQVCQKSVISESYTTSGSRKMFENKESAVHVGIEVVSIHLCRFLLSQHKKALIHQLTTMLSTSKNVFFPGHNHLLTADADDLTL